MFDAMFDSEISGNEVYFANIAKPQRKFNQNKF